MAKLTNKQREQAKKDLQDRLTTAIEESPRGLTDEEMRMCVLKACVETKPIKI
jgi:hypothetical protein